MTKYVLGIDGGGTKTQAVLMDKTAKILGTGEAGPSNYQSIGEEQAKNSIIDAIIRAIADANLTMKTIDIAGIGLGLAGAGRAEDIALVKTWLPEIMINTANIQWSLSEGNILVCNDSLIALVGGIGEPVGMVVIAGTGSQIFGQNQQGLTKRVGGWGYLLGDEGSGYDIAIQGLKAVFRAYDGRDANTSLTSAFLNHLNLVNVEGLIKLIYRSGWRVTDIAALAKIVDQEAMQADLIANQIIQGAIAELILGVKVVYQDLFTFEPPIELVTMGGVWQSQANFRNKFIDQLKINHPAIQVIWPRYSPAYGAGLLVLD
ncbi:MAG: N-acetylglucosamine kinase [Microcoleaceae cyanobacterium]